MTNIFSWYNTLMIPLLYLLWCLASVRPHAHLLSHPLTNGLGAGGKVERLQFGVDRAITLLSHKHLASLTLTHTHCNTIRLSNHSNKLQLQLHIHIKYDWDEYFRLQCSKCHKALGVGSLSCHCVIAEWMTIGKQCTFISEDARSTSVSLHPGHNH